MIKHYDVIRKGEIVCTGDQFNVKEWLEDAVADKLDFCPMLQEDVDTDENEFNIDIHSEAEYSLTDEDYDTWNKLIGFENIHQNVLNLLEITIQVAVKGNHIHAVV